MVRAKNTSPQPQFCIILYPKWTAPTKNHSHFTLLSPHQCQKKQALFIEQCQTHCLALPVIHHSHHHHTMRTRRNGGLVSWEILLFLRAIQIIKRQPYGVQLMMKPRSSIIHTSSTAPLKNHHVAVRNPFSRCLILGAPRLIPSLKISGTTVCNVLIIFNRFKIFDHFRFQKWTFYVNIIMIPWSFCSTVRTNSSVPGAAWGKVNLTAKALTGGGFEALYKQTFTSTNPNEKLKKTFACYLSTTTGPVAGTLYLSDAHAAFCSDRPLSFTAPSGQGAWSYYKVKKRVTNQHKILCDQ